MNALITVNGKTEQLDNPILIIDYLKQKNYRPEIVVVEQNEHIISREHFAEVEIKPGDRIEIVTFMGGGC